MSELVLYEHPLSPYAQKVKLALLTKSIPFSLVNLAMMTDTQRAEFAAWNPRAEVPVLVDDGFAIYDSTIILEYIEDRWPEPPLLPLEPQARARVRIIEEAMDTHFESNTWGLSEVKHFGRASGSLANTLSAFGHNEIRQWFSWLDHQLGNDPYFNGSHVGWGDICVVPFVNGATRFGLYPESETALSAWHTMINEHEHVIACKTEADAWELDPALMQEALAAGFKREYRDHRVEWMIRAGGITVVEAGLQADNLRFNEPFPT